MTYAICSSEDARNTAPMSHVSGWIHDKWFDVDAIAFDSGSSSVSIPLSDRKSEDPKLLLRCEGVAEVNVADTEKIGTYDINAIRWNPSSRTLLLKGNIPITVSMRMHDKWRVVVESISDCRS